MSQVPLVVDPEKRLESRSSATHKRFKPSADDEATQFLWATYLDQANNYDKLLLEGWKGDMGGMLLFSALYSAILAPFLIESYPRLQADPADATVAILTQMSQQLASLSNGTTFTSESRPPFEPDTASMVCNTLWFLSLALAITCSLLATFVQQWVRDFLHKTAVRPSPIAKARILAFSYFGLRRFGMHTFVDIIPMLMHISLSFFFAGLVAFLYPINRPLAYLMACILGIFIFVYLGLSCIPLVYLDAPYRTPVSDLIWRFGIMLRGFFLRRHHHTEEPNLTEAMLEASFKDYKERDRQCMKFTMKSLNTDVELLPLLWAIPEAVIRSSTEVRAANLELIAPILRSPDPDENIISRISAFITVSGFSADPERQNMGMETALRALWSLARLVIDHGKKQLSTPNTTTPVLWFDRDLLTTFERLGSAPTSYVISAFALVRTSRLQSFRCYIDAVANKLSTETSNRERLRMAKDVFEGVSFGDIHWTSNLFRQHFSQLGITLRKGHATGISDTRAEELVKDAKGHVSELQSPGRWKAALMFVLGEFLFWTTSLKVIPFEMDLTHDLICDSIPGVFDSEQTVEVEHDEAEVSLLLRNISSFPNDVPEEVFRLVFQLAFSTERALLSRDCRGIVITYLYHMGRIVWPIDLRWDRRNDVGQCILQDIRDSDSQNPSLSVILIRSIYHALPITSLQVPQQLRDFAMQIFELIPKASEQFTQDRWWHSIEAYTEWILCKDILNRLDTSNNDTVPAHDPRLMDDVCSLGRRVFSDDVQTPKYPSSGKADECRKWAEEIKAYVMSINLLMVSKFISINCDTDDPDGRVYMGDWVGMQCWLFNYSGHIFDDVQLQFAKSVRTLGSIWNQPPAARRVFQESIWRLSQHWCWITNVESAKILLEVIRQHKDSRVFFRGWIGHEQELFNRCTELTEKAKAGKDLAEDDLLQ
ncbi:hypothetical protein K435DRAFT_714364 [Dendrothele bispora CBS 962.96]|uniref:DUF6535 domain-containing protein n=1 Tax=Dendrothele bispora (strain CBS 962.96) TaxID=1314807 RepID=A0A4S8MPS8_DENBC|nr:hypothetical protein K435DRAFT_714364 [Dendrothele bispora CBS 962.96]